LKKFGLIFSFFISILILASTGIIQQSYAGTGGGGGGIVSPGLVRNIPVGGVFEPVNEAVLYGELAKQYSIWLIPVIGIGVGIYFVKRKF